MTWIDDAARAEFTRLAYKAPDGGLRRRLNDDHMARQRRFFAAPKVEVAAPAPVPRERKSKLDIFCETLIAAVSIVRGIEADLTCKIADIQRHVAAHYGTTRMDILSERRTADAVLPRHVAIYLARKLTPRSLPEIGRQFGGKDHTTCFYAIRRITERIATDPDFAAEVDAIRTELTRS